MKNLRSLLITFLLISFANSYSQGQWTWVKGPNTFLSGLAVINIQPVETTTLTPHPNNYPGGVNGSPCWTDDQGIFWLYATGGGYGAGDEIWKYDPATNMWTLMRGQRDYTSLTNIPPIYGTQGVSNSTNTPGNRQGSCMFWKDNNGKFWLFGGKDANNNYLNDMWMYDPDPMSTDYNKWTWVNGSSTPLFVQPGVVNSGVGVYDPLNSPGGRYHAATWTDNNGLLWLFGGDGWNNAAAGSWPGNMNDLWVFNPNPGSPAYGQWKQVRDNFYNAFGSINYSGYGAKGVAAIANTPGGRFGNTAWTDLSGDLWLWGGNGMLNSGSGKVGNDLWKYNINGDTWTWVSGDSVENVSGNYGPICNAAINYIPAGRTTTAAHWTDECGNLWMYGGMGLLNNNLVSYGDLWKYNIQQNKWALMNGSSITNTTATYGTMGQAAAANYPGTRAGSCYWKNKNGLWLYGGYAIVSSYAMYIGDFFRYADKPDAIITPSITSACNFAAVNFNNNSTANCNDMLHNYNWNFADPSSGSLNNSSAANASHTFNAAGSYTVSMVVDNCLGVRDTTYSVVTINSGPGLTTSANNATCGQNNGSTGITITSGTGPYTYLWNNGMTTNSLSSISGGFYNATVTGSNGCPTFTTSVVNTSGGPTINPIATVSISCFGMNNGSTNAVVTGGSGNYSYLWSNGNTNAIVSNLTVGSYSVSILDNATSCISTQTFIVVQPGAISVSVTPVSSSCGVANGGAAITATGGSSPYLYSWFNGGTLLSVSGLAPGTYTVATFDNNLCPVITSFTVNAGTVLTATLTGPTSVTCFGSTDGTAAVNILSGPAPYSYQWFGTTGTGNSVSNLSAGTYSVTVTDSAGCIKSLAMAITEPSVLTSTITTHDIICGNNNSSAFVSASGGISSYHYLWNTGSTNQVQNNLPVGTYSVIITDYLGCTMQNTCTINAINGPQAIAGVGATIIKGNSFQLNSSGGGNYLWTPSTGLNCNTCNAPIASPEKTTRYYVTVTDGNGCSSTDSLDIFVIDYSDCDVFVPNAFSPNGDGNNDALQLNAPCPADILFMIMDRWGEVIYTSEDINQTWDGTFKGRELNTGVFIYTLRARIINNPDIRKTGNISLIR